MKPDWLMAAAVATLLLSPAGSAATDAHPSAKPTAKQIAAARGDCSKHRRKVERLEADTRTDPSLLDKERSEWERSCAHAEMLMQAAGIEKPSPPPPAVPPPPPTLVIQEGPIPGNKPIVIDEPTAPPTTDAKAPSSTLPEKPSESAPPPPPLPGPYEPAQPPP